MAGDTEPRAAGWRCGLCSELFEPTGHGHNLIREHLFEDHDAATPKGNVVGLVAEGGEILLPGWGVQVLQAARRRGYIAEAPAKQKARVLESPEEAAGFATEAKPEAPLPKLTTRQRKLAQAYVDQTGRTVLKDVIIQRPVEILFYEAQGVWPHLYGAGTSEQFSNFIAEMVICGSIASGMQLGAMIASEVANKLKGVEEDDEYGDEAVPAGYSAR